MQEKFSHSLPLITFTTLLPVAIGLVIGAAHLRRAYEIDILTLQLILNWSISLSVIASIIVSFHLGHPKKGHTSIRGILHSCLSREIIFGGAFAGLLMISIIVSYTTPESDLLIAALICTGFFGLTTSFVIGRVYDLTAQLTWRGIIPSAAPPLASLLVALATVFIYTLPAERSSYFRNLFCLTLGIDTLFTIIRLWQFIHLKKNSYILSYPHCKTPTLASFFGKIALATFLMINVIRGEFPMALSFVLLLILLDRTAFYASAARKTPRSNIADAKNQRMLDALNSTSNH
ncbi:MAG: dimethyl sulfoxide reductase anchor subunit [Planctomycetes bacterium]|nr:dimethyl sulfoxide reductase anchor subunit [Planctomycetota bacterium]